MPINLKYGQKAVERGLISPQRLQQVLAKQRQLAAQGKKVSVRMILEKAKLLNAAQLAQVDRDLNIKVVKKPSKKVSPSRPKLKLALPESEPESNAYAQAGGIHPQQVPQEDDIESGQFLMGDEPAPLAEMSPEPFAEMSPEPFGEVMPEPADFGEQPMAGDWQVPHVDDAQPWAEPNLQGTQPLSGGYGDGFGDVEPMADPYALPDMQPMADAFGDHDMQPMADAFADEMQPISHDDTPSLQRVESSPHLSSLHTEFESIAPPESEELPILDSPFDEAPAEAYAPPAAEIGPELAPTSGAEFDRFGNDIMSPEDLESGARPAPAGANLEVTMFSPPPPGVSRRQGADALDRTMFSPKPESFRVPDTLPEMQPAAQSQWGDDDMNSAAFEETAQPEEMNPSVPQDSQVSEELPGDEFPAEPEYDDAAFAPTAPRQGSSRSQGRVGSSDFSDVELPAGKQMDDLPTSPSRGDDVHPLRRGFTAHQPAADAHRPGSKPPSQPPAEPAEREEVKYDTQPVLGRKTSGMQSEPKRKSSRKHKTGEPEPAEKKKRSRVALVFSLLLIVLVAVAVLPVVLQDSVTAMADLRNEQHVKGYYDHVEDAYDGLRRMLGLPVPPRKGKPEIPLTSPQPTTPPEGDAPPAEAPPAEPPAEGETPPGEQG